MTQHTEQPSKPAIALPAIERIQQELAAARNIDDFFGKDGIFARLFATTLEQMLEAELTAHLGYEPYAASGRNSGNSRNGKRARQIRTSAGDMSILVPRDRNSEFAPALLDKYQTSSNELEEKITALYAKGVSTRDIQQMLQDLYGVEVSPATISAITDKVWSLVEAWQSRPLQIPLANPCSEARCGSNSHFAPAARQGRKCRYPRFRPRSLLQPSY